MIFIFKLILLLIIAAVFIVIAIWCRKRHTQFMTNAVEVNGTSVGSIRVDLPREVKTMYAQKVFFDCPFTKKDDMQSAMWPLKRQKMMKESRLKSMWQLRHRTAQSSI